MSAKDIIFIIVGIFLFAGGVAGLIFWIDQFVAVLEGIAGPAGLLFGALFFFVGIEGAKEAKLESEMKTEKKEEGEQHPEAK